MGLSGWSAGLMLDKLKGGTEAPKDWRAELDNLSDEEVAAGLMNETDFVFDLDKSERSFLGKYGLYVAIAAGFIILLVIVNYMKK